MKKAFFFVTLILLGTIVLCAGAPASAEVEGTRLELGIGGGLNLNGLGTAQVLFTPALSIPISKSVIHLRVEGDLEMISADGETMIVGGVSPMVRFSASGKLRPFIELGPGVNYASRKDFGERHLGGPLFFSAMGGVGVEVPLGRRLLSISYRVRHLSNGNLSKDGNEGLNSQYLMISISL